MSIVLDINTSKLGAINPCEFTIAYPELIMVPETSRVIGFDRDDNPLTEYARYEVAMVTAYIWNSVFNVAAKYSNNTLKYTVDNAVTWKTVTFPDGTYSIEDLNNEMQRQMDANNDVPTVGGIKVYPIALVPNYSTMKVRIELESPSDQLDLTVGLLYQLLGWTASVITATGEGSSYADVTRGVDSYQIHASCVNSGYDNSVAGDVIYSFNFQSRPGTQERFEPVNPIYLPLRDKGSISSIRVRVTDQLGRVADFNGEDIFMRLHIRRVY